MTPGNLSKRTDVISSVLGVLHSEDLVIDAIQDLIKDEIKQQIRSRIMADEEVREELKNAISLFIEYKIKELYAAMKLAKAGAKVSLSLVPESLQEEISAEFVRIFEKELSSLFEKSL